MARYLSYGVPVDQTVPSEDELQLRHHQEWGRVSVTSFQQWSEDRGSTELWLDEAGLRVLIAAAQVMLGRLAP